MEITKELNGKSVLYREFGMYVKTNKEDFYKIKNVYIFSNDKVYIIDNYFYDNFKDYMVLNGETTRKNKIDLTLKHNFVIKASVERFDYEVKYNLYINADLNNYKFNKLELNGEQFNIYYELNGEQFNHCIGWNNKKSNAIKYDKQVEELYKYIHYFDNRESFNESMKKYVELFEEYKKAIEEEKSYSIEDYKKFNLSSGTTEEENKLMLVNNGFEI
jgi:hypothetical protein